MFLRMKKASLCDGLEPLKVRWNRKADWYAVDSPKKRTDEFDLFAVKSKKAIKTNSSVCFLGESMVRQSAFKINWPLEWRLSSKHKVGAFDQIVQKGTVFQQFNVYVSPLTPEQQRVSLAAIEYQNFTENPSGTDTKTTDMSGFIWEHQGALWCSQHSAQQGYAPPHNGVRN
jgi:hypothetical protein